MYFIWLVTLQGQERIKQSFFRQSCQTVAVFPFMLQVHFLMGHRNGYSFSTKRFGLQLHTSKKYMENNKKLLGRILRRIGRNISMLRNTVEEDGSSRESWASSNISVEQESNDSGHHNAGTTWNMKYIQEGSAGCELYRKEEHRLHQNKPELISVPPSPLFILSPPGNPLASALGPISKGWPILATSY